MTNGYQYYVKKDGTVSVYKGKPDWEKPTRKCCICGAVDAPIPHDRPSGRKMTMQRWYFCRSCWERHCGICGIKIEEVA